MQWNFNKALATARVIKLFQAGKHVYREDAKIGVILNQEVAYARSSAPHDQQAAFIYDLFFNRVFLDPSIKGVYPDELMELLIKHDILFDHDKEELDIIRKHTVDFVGINLYHPQRVKAPSRQWNESTPFHPAYYYEHFQLPGRKMNPYRGWEIYPRIVYDMGMRLKNEYGNIGWLIAENGMGVEQEERFKNEEGIIQDDYRIAFISSHLAEAMKAIAAGSNCKGYMLWAFTDNVSPMNAFKNRYGLVEIQLEENRNRVLKKSADFYRNIIENRQFETDEFTYK